MFQNYKPAFHKFSAELLKDKYPEHAETIERMSHFFPTEKDVTLLSKLFVQLFENGYLSAVEQYKQELTKLGISVQIKQSKG